jgi:hypothetical protein
MGTISFGSFLMKTAAKFGSANTMSGAEVGGRTSSRTKPIRREYGRSSGLNGSSLTIRQADQAAHLPMEMALHS